MPTIEKILPKNECKLEIEPFLVNDVEIFRIDWTRYMNAQRKKKNMTITLQIKEDK
jgi:hypothetical protein